MSSEDNAADDNRHLQLPRVFRAVDDVPTTTLGVAEGSATLEEKRRPDFRSAAAGETRAPS